MLSIESPSFSRGGMPVAEPFLLSDQHFRDINPVDCGWERCEPSHSFGPTARMYWLLHYVVSGSGVFESGGVRHPVRGGQMFVIRPLETTFYQADEHDPWEYIWIGFTTALTLPAPLREQAVVQHSGLGSLFSSVLRLRTMTQGRELFLCGQVYQLLSLLSEQPAVGKRLCGTGPNLSGQQLHAGCFHLRSGRTAWPEPLVFQHALSSADRSFAPAVPSPLPHGARPGASVQPRLYPRRGCAGRRLS